MTPTGRARWLPVVAVGCAAVVAVSLTLAYVARGLDAPQQTFSDFRINVWYPGRALLDGRSPLRDYEADVQDESTVYPPAAVVMTLPYALPPHRIAVTLWVLTLVVAVVLALWICGVRDWRCFGLGLASPPVLYGLAYANVSLLVVLAVALIWVWRNQPRRLAIVLGAVIAARLFLWPLVVWLLLTGRRRAAGETVVATALFSLIGWAAVGFDRIGEFPEIIRRNATDFIDDGVSVASVVSNLGASDDVAICVAMGLGVCALALAWHTRHVDVESFAWGISAALFMSPVVWAHYYALLLVPLAVATPTLSRSWLLPYLTVPQLTVAPQKAGRIIDAASGITFAVLTALRCRRRSTVDGQRHTPGVGAEPADDLKAL